MGREPTPAQKAFGSPASFKIWLAMCRLFVRGTAKVLPVAGLNQISWLPLPGRTNRHRAAAARVPDRSPSARPQDAAFKAVSPVIVIGPGAMPLSRISLGTRASTRSTNSLSVAASTFRPTMSL